MNHVPGYIQNLPQLREKGVDIVAVLAFNDPFVMSAWGKANKVRGNDIVSQNPFSRHCSGHKLILHTALPFRPRCQVLQEHWLGRQRVRPHGPLCYCHRSWQGQLRPDRDREGCRQGKADSISHSPRGTELIRLFNLIEVRRRCCSRLAVEHRSVATRYEYHS